MTMVCLCALGVQAQMVDPVQWSQRLRMTDDKHGVVELTAAIEHGWHVYGTDIPDGGPTATSVKWDVKGATLEGSPTPNVAPTTQHDDNFDMDLSWWSNNVTLRQKFTATDPKFSINGTVRYMACNDQTCMAPTTHDFALNGTAKLDQPEPEKEPEDKTEPTDNAADTVAPDTTALTAQLSTLQADTWAPVTFSQAADTATTGASSNRSLWYIFFACFMAGFLALLTPCVWPIIPMTVSYFLKRGDSNNLTQNSQKRQKNNGFRDALLYGLAIIVIYVALGLLVTILFGANALNAIATNAVCNIVFFLLLVLFAISFFGAFDIKLPSSWSNRLDQKAEKTTGALSIFFMAFTLVIVSFSCTGPIIGTLLVETANQGNRLGPAIGMLGFALALAIPFSLFALFPSWLKKLPKSGGWLNTVKVTLGFLELALALKFLSVADLAYGWHILDRETFLALWIAIFGALGLYLLGVFRLKSDDATTGGIGVVRLLCGLVSLAFTAYLVPGLWGAPLRVTSAFVPPLYTQDFNLYGEELRQYDDYDAAMAAAQKTGKPVFLDFSGYGCVNCRKMDGAVLDRDEVKKLIQDNFITIQLMVDDKAELPAPRYVEENGKHRELTTVGDLWSYLQRHKFGANSQPYYVVLDPQGNLLSGPVAYDENITAFIDFLNKGLTHAKQKQATTHGGFRPPARHSR